MNSKLYIVVFLLIGLMTSNGYGQNSDKEMQNILKERREYNQTHKEVEGYRIQLYNGLNETKAKSILGTFSVFFPEITSHLLYEQPEWKVQTVTFHSELEAYRNWLKVREEFEGTFIFEVKKKSK